MPPLNEPDVGAQMGRAAGAPQAPAGQSSNSNTGTGCLVAIVIIVVLGLIGALMGSGDDDDSPSGSGGGGRSSDEPDVAEPDVEELHFGAFDVCKQFVTDRLKAPSTAKFRNYFEDDGEVNVSGGPSEFTVISSVDSENGFGAMLRSEFVCTVTHVSGGNWRLVDVTLLE